MCNDVVVIEYERRRPGFSSARVAIERGNKSTEI